MADTVGQTEAVAEGVPEAQPLPDTEGVPVSAGAALWEREPEPVYEGVAECDGDSDSVFVREAV